MPIFNKILFVNCGILLHLQPATVRRCFAQMAELVDALDSKSCFRKGVGVRFPLWALK
jgi:hypothetical protein